MGTTVSFTRPDGQELKGWLAEPARPGGAPAVVVIQEWWGLNLMTNLDFGDAATQDVRGAIRFLKTRAAKVGCLGFCMGGALTLLAAANVPELDAAVTWYGCPPLEFIDVAKIKAPLQGHWADQDEFFPPALVQGLTARLEAAGVAHDFHHYLAHHAFGNEQAVGEGRIAETHYDPVWAQRARPSCDRRRNAPCRGIDGVRQGASVPCDNSSQVCRTGRAGRRRDRCTKLTSGWRNS
ncbi:MAG: dienelactone hydrolase family protein, partial [Lysobacter sp.]|nr:dienelactone hydrolase family protein [Lysobacter sp.]